MNNLILLVLVYISYIIIWFVINIIVYLLSIITKKRIIDIFTGFASIVVAILNTIIGLGLFVYMISLLYYGQIFLFVVFIFIGHSIATNFIGFLQAPILLIPSYLSQKLDSIDLKEEIVTAEILDEENNVIGVIEGDTTITRKLAKNFILFYLSLLGYMIIFPAEREGAQFVDYISKPFFQVLTSTVLFGFFYSGYRKFKYHKFFPEDKRNYFSQVWKIGFYFTLIFGIFLFLIANLTSTY